VRCRRGRFGAEGKPIVSAASEAASEAGADTASKFQDTDEGMYGSPCCHVPAAGRSPLLIAGVQSNATADHSKEQRCRRSWEAPAQERCSPTDPDILQGWFVVRFDTLAQRWSSGMAMAEQQYSAHTGGSACESRADTAGAAM
jgi:hypothetical protein